MNKLEPGMYVRTDKGLISQITDFKKHCTKGKRLINSYSTKEVVENYLLLKGNQCEFVESIDYSIPPCYPSDEELEKIKSHIVKASFNIIDLIEVGDYINGYKITLLTENHDVAYAEDEEGYLIKSFNNSNIKSIVTKEQFKAMEYEVGK